jgi:hypothetical protein
MSNVAVSYSVVRAAEAGCALCGMRMSMEGRSRDDRYDHPSLFSLPHYLGCGQDVTTCELAQTVMDCHARIVFDSS